MSARRLIMVIEGGGMRNAAIAAFLQRLDELGFDRKRVKAIWASSSAAVTAALYIAGQAREAVRMYSTELIKPEVFDWWRVLQLRRPANIHYMVERACSLLDMVAFGEADTKLVVNVLDLEGGKIHYLEVRPENICDLLEACCAIPLLAKAVKGRLVDGGVAVPMPLLPAYWEEGPADYIVLSNKPPGYDVPSDWYLRARLLLPFRLAACRTVQRASSYYRAWRQFVRNPPDGARVLVIQPDAELPCTRFDRSPERVEAAISVGWQLADENGERLMAFLSGVETNAISA